MSRLFGLSACALFLIATFAPVTASELTIASTIKPELKSVYGVVQSRDVIPARARLGGTITSLAVEAGTAVNAGDVLATIVDEKLALQLQASDANIKSVEAQLANANTELARAKKLMESGVTTKTAFDAAQTQADVLASQLKAAQAAKAVLEQQGTEGKVLAPASGRILSVPVTKGSVVMPGEPVAQLASGTFYLRLSLPERHASSLKEGSSVEIRRGLDSNDSSQTKTLGKLEKLYPQIEGGKVNADVVVLSLGDYFVGQRVLVDIPVDERAVIAVPVAAVSTRSGIDYVKLASPQGADVPVITGERFGSSADQQIEILSGLAVGDKVMVP